MIEGMVASFLIIGEFLRIVKNKLSVDLQIRPLCASYIVTPLILSFNKLFSDVKRKYKIIDGICSPCPLSWFSIVHSYHGYIKLEKI